MAEEQKKSIAEIAKKYGLALAVLFGSQATGHTHKKSDVDIGYISSKTFDDREEYDITLDCAKVFGNKDVQLTRLDKVSPVLKKQVADEGILLYEKSSGLFLNFRVGAYKSYMETKPLREYRDRYIKNFVEKYA